ncbi:aspartic peptidase [Tanacetum coccineum]
MKDSSAEIVSHEKNPKKVKFRALFNSEIVADSDFVLPLETIQTVKHNFQKIMNDEDGFFFFKFASISGVKQVLEQGPWLIRNTHLILQKWTPNMSFTKDKVTKVPVLVKMHRVPTVAYSKDGLSLIGSQIGKLIMIDAFTSSMCVDPWGRIRFARSLIEVSAETDLKQEVIMDEAEVPSDWFHYGDDKKKNKGKEPDNGWNTNQVMHVKVFHKATNKIIYCSFIYAGNLPTERRLLWADLGLRKNVVRGFPWVLMGDFNDCVSKIEVMDINSTGLHYTWNQKPKGGGGKLKNLDLIMGNLDFLDTFPGAYAIFQPYRILDHSPAVLKLPSLLMNKPKPFKFFNFISFKSKFHDVVSSHWNMHVFGHCMFQVVSKMKALKNPLRKLIHDHGNLHDRVNKLRLELDEVQKALDRNPDDSVLRDEEVVYVTTFVEAKLDEELKNRNQLSRIEVIRDANDVEVTGSLVADAFVSHYHQFLGTSMVYEELHTEGLFMKNVSATSNLNMVKPVSDEEIRAAMFDIGDDRASCPDGYTSAFFKKSWYIIGNDICFAVRDFFSNAQLLKEINHTFITLIPKVATPMKINDYRPISCRNVIYKCISKILTNRIIEGIKEVVSENQYAFVPGRRISDNILITQELMHGYHRNRGPPRCAFKVDIQKAYDTVDWRFLENILRFFGFYPTMVSWIMACVTSTSFSISLNGDIHGYFKGCRGFPYPFTLVMYISTPYHSKKGSFRSNISGVPLISHVFPKLRIRKILLRRVKNRIKDWKNKSLSFVGRLQLCKSVISSMHVYWASVLMIPIGIIHDIQQHMCGFLLCNGELKRGKAKVAWDDICLPKKESGLGIRTNGGWLWPQAWLLKAPDLGLVPGLPGKPLDREGMNLKTQDKLRQWDVGVGTDLNLLQCAFCNRRLDSHSHLFFECPFSSKVWEFVRPLAGKEHVPPCLHDILLELQPIANNHTAKSVIGRLIVAATTYFVWLERNNRLFKKVKIKAMVHSLLSHWKMPSNFRLY